MVGKIVDCVVKSNCGKRRINGTIVKRCDSPHVYILKLSHSVEFVDSKTFTYPKGSTILVTESEIVK